MESHCVMLSASQARFLAIVAIRASMVCAIVFFASGDASVLDSLGYSSCKNAPAGEVASAGQNEV